jgi:pimeloyl-ACP methyl ester carboxylesterase
VRVVCVHGIGQQVLGEETLLGEWLPALRDGLTRAGAAGTVDDGDVGMAFYGDVFRPAGQRLDVGDPPYTPADVDDGFERDLLLAWWAEAARVDPGVVPPGADTLVRVPGSAQAALRALSRSRFFAKVALRAMVSDLKQVRRYLTDPGLRDQVRDRVVGLIDADTPVVVGHSLGSVVAYEALCEYRTRAGGNGPALVTLGSPLGIPNLAFDRLDPAPTAGVGVWPCPEGAAWTNVADSADVVALVRTCGRCSGSRCGVSRWTTARTRTARCRT